VENLRTTKYNDGTPIPHVTDSSAWYRRSTPAYCWYNNNEGENKEKYGALYNWAVVDPTNPAQIAPEGWRVPTSMDWANLKNHLITNGYNWDGTTTDDKIAKSLASRSDWIRSTNAGSPGNEISTNNASGFSALPGGYRFCEGSFLGKSEYCWWWTATTRSSIFAHSCFITNHAEDLSDSNVFHKNYGLSVRLMRDLN
jgi:uncharacterized protein (TIGR02145 family)